MAQQDNRNVPLAHLDVARVLPLLAFLGVSRGDATPYQGDEHSLAHLPIHSLIWLLQRWLKKKAELKGSAAPFPSFQLVPTTRPAQVTPVFLFHRPMSRKLLPDELYRRAQGNGYKYRAYYNEDNKTLIHARV